MFVEFVRDLGLKSMVSPFFPTWVSSFGLYVSFPFVAFSVGFISGSSLLV